ncbi:DsbE family thiol:disulfide interchange protein [Vibrio sp. JC009]|uniref:DsbE family thiol:disulfide interchange protein n=1 Tax=Vibrio sp. JC009 TaxID=2912314 RepID=UPI0023B1CE61|nr:DsbE family thiol:disulfide interchange protein [Vibrio sp. JC009]WED20582.1 DsbE family thiol:disulfide interchange protein [Vibrio sp. JC009]
MKLGIFALVIAVVFGAFIYALEGDVTASNQAMLNQPVPEFTLQDLAEPSVERQTKDVLPGKYSLLNVWASWCAACREEHGFLIELKNQGVLIYGVNYRDQRKDALKVLDELSSPYQFTLYDHQGSLALDLGVIGAPETFLISPDGKILTRFSGVLDRKVWDEQFVPMMKEAR